ncbi:MAG: ATP-dependent metallopeptidase FtsH/Yme1/Tma family protein [Deltaproteobacteria bacterium]|nr:MAG: ATP-dependent metallopeptidase FtsH/Yme1/Tma family protein [Deltaproteobacteria bacterium]
MRNIWRGNFIWFLVLLGVLGIIVTQGPLRGDKPVELSFSELMAHVRASEVKEITFKGQQVRGTLTVPPEGSDAPAGETNFVSVGPTDLAPYFEIMEANGLTPNHEQVEDESLWVTVLLSFLPLLVMAGILVWFLRNLQSGGSRAMSFGRSRHKVLNENSKRITFADVAGIDECKEELSEIVEFLRDPRRFTRLGGRIPKGVLLMGPPGTGKTLLARAVAGEAGVPFFSMSGSDFVEMFVGVGASRVRDLFEQAKKQSPCIVFIDEIDAVGRHRGAGLGGGHDEREQTLNQLLVEMDGFESTDYVILVAATNRPDVLDPALLRPGRFDRRVVVPAPDVRGREAILAIHSKRIPLAEAVDLEVIAKGTPGFSGADLENLCNEAALNAARLRKDQVEQADFELAREKVMMGPERRSLVMSEHERRNTAYHEAGHALVAYLLPNHDPVHKVTIVPRGRALGVTMTVPDEDRLSHTRRTLFQRIAMAMGGRAAEEVALNEITSGAANDIEQATRMARFMVCELGMSDSLGPVSWGEGQGEVFLGREMARSKSYSEDTAQRIDAEVRAIVGRGYDAAKSILENNLHVLHAVAGGLIDRESLDRREFEELVDQAGPSLPEGLGWMGA